jgi:hypothetical protein|tara:strand:+ start:1235 stop:1534 length:300 start_codon:yes stop_codon:yes gene_type:complete
MINLVKIPKAFIKDCYDCCCEVPETVRFTKQHFFVSKVRDDLMNELISRAIYYVEMGKCGGFSEESFGLVMSARATLRALIKNNVLNDYQIKKCKFIGV